MRIQDIKPIQVIHCNTEAKANILCKKLHQLGYRWGNNSLYINNNEWHSFKQDTCYNITNGAKQSMSWYLNDRYEIIPFDELDLDDFPKKWYLQLTELYDVELKKLNDWRLKQPNCSYVEAKLKTYHTLLSKHEQDNSYFYSNPKSILINEPFYKDYVEITLEQFKKHYKINKMENFKLSNENALKIVNIACPTWKTKLADLWARNIFLNNYVEITKEFYDEMIKAANIDQMSVINGIMGDHFKSKEIDLTKPETINGLELFIKNGTRNDAMIAIRKESEYEDKAFYLNDDFEWEIKTDSENLLCLIPTHK